MAAAAARAKITDLSDRALAAVFERVPQQERRSLALVCRRFRAVACASGDLWKASYLCFPASFEHSLNLAAMYAWFVRWEGVMSSLHVDLSTAAAWAPVAAVLGVVGRRLQHLRVAGDAEGCLAPGGATAPWMALVPHLASLELDNVADHSISAAHFPTSACAGRGREAALAAGVDHAPGGGAACAPPPTWRLCPPPLRRRPSLSCGARLRVAAHALQV